VQQNRDGEQKSFKLYGLFSLVFLLSSSALFSTSFEEFKRSQAASFAKYADERDNAFNNYLKAEWKAYNAHKGIKLYEKPKPKKISSAKPKKIKSIGPKISIKVKKVKYVKPKPVQKFVVVKKTAPVPAEVDKPIVEKPEVKKVTPKKEKIKKPKIKETVVKEQPKVQKPKA
jgi:hypothetical protein